MWRVHKFGGSSLADDKCFINVKNIVLNEHESKSAIVVSAVKGVTNLLINIDENNFETTKREILFLHDKIIKGVSLSKVEQKECVDFIENDLVKINRMSHSMIHLSLNAKNEMKEIISSFGELWSSFILNKMLKKQGSNRIEAQKFISLKDREKI